MNSEYMEWAKNHAGARYDLAASGLTSFPMKDFPAPLNELELTGNGSYGYEPLVHAIASRYGVGIGNVMTAMGTSMANHFVMAGLLDRDDEVLVEHPTYELLLSTARYFDVTVKTFPRRFENGYQIDPEDIRLAISPKTKLIIVTNLHNPSSAYMDTDSLREIGAIARGIGAHVLVDEVYLETMFEKTPSTAFLLGEEFVITNSLTKVYGLSGLRCGWIIGEERLIRRLWRMSDLFYVNAPYATDQMSVLALARLDLFRARARRLLDENHRLLSGFLDSRSDLQVVRPGYGTVVFPRLVRGSVEKLCSMLREKYETSVVPGNFFGMYNHFRVGIGRETEIVKAGLERLGAALDEVS